MGRSLNESENSLILRSVGTSFEVISSAIARLYYAESGSWEYNCLGAAILLADRSKNSFLIRVLDIGSSMVNFSQELYANFEYAQPRPFFHTFESENGVVGLSFADETDATEFYHKVMDCKSGRAYDALPPPPMAARGEITPRSAISRSDYQTNQGFSRPEAKLEVKSQYGTMRPERRPDPQADRPDPSAPAATFTSITPSNSSSSSKQSKKEKKKKKGWFGGEDDELIISEPSNFRHLSSIGWSPTEATFEIRNIPPEWRKLFQAAGIKKSDLKDKDTAKQIMSIIDQHGGEAAISSGPPTQRYGPPPPPPGGPRGPNNSNSNSNSKPPPPPGRPMGGQGGAIPPPPSGPRPQQGGAPPPPPPPSFGGAPPPPPPPINNQSYESSFEAPLPPPQPQLNVDSPKNSGRGALLKSIQQGTSLRKIDKDEWQNSQPAPAPKSSNALAATLAKAMETRRIAIKEEVEEDWSDNEWDNE